jgi:uncharacterized protein UPF0164
MLRPLRGTENRLESILHVVLATLISASLLYVQVRPVYADVAVGGGTGDFLQFEIGGRSAGMGGAQVGSASGVTAQFWNPAGLASLERPQVGGMHAAWLGDLKYEWIGYARPMSPKLGVGSLSVAYFHMPSIQGVDEFGTPTGEFKVYDMAVTAGLSRPVGSHLSVGANTKLIRQTLATVSATGLAVDFGAQAKGPRGVTFGAVVQNLGPSLSFDGASYPLSRQIRVGASGEVANGRVLLATDYNMPSDYYDDVRVGAEVRAHPNVSLRLGYRREMGAGENPQTGFSYGLGFQFKQLNLDYAMTPNEDFDNIHRLSFGYSFGTGAPEKEPKQPKKEEPKEEPAPEAPKGPRVIAEATPEAPKPAAKAVAPKPAAQTQTPKPAAPKETPAAALTTVATSETKPEAQAPKAADPAPKAVPVQYAVVMPGYPSKDSAEAEMKALELLGFRTKDAQIVKDPKRGGFMITFTRMKSKGSAEEVAANLQRMSFRALVEVAQK